MLTPTSQVSAVKTRIRVGVTAAVANLGSDSAKKGALFFHRNLRT
jgi:hypothetical protein